MGNRASTLTQLQLWQKKHQDIQMTIGMFAEKEVNTELEKQRQRYRPKSVKLLCEETGFTRREIQLLYRSFKENCPNGIVTIQRFQEIFNSFFYFGDASEYAKLVFTTIDADSNGEISFEEFVHNLSTLWRGPLDQKIRWIFTLYDLQGQGHITETDIVRVLKAVYDMMGKSTSPPTASDGIQEHARNIFQKMDADNDGKIYFHEFLQCCLQDVTICESLELFNTILDANRCLLQH